MSSRRRVAHLVKVAVPFVASAGVGLASQVLGLGLYVGIAASSAAGPESDAFFLVLGWAQFPMQVAVVGVAYPLLLRGEDRAGARWMKIGCAGSPLVGLLASGALVAGSKIELDQVAAPLAAVVYSALVVCAYARAYRLAANGHTRPLVTATLWGSAGGVLGVLVALWASWHPLLVPAMGAILGQAVTLAWPLLRHRADVEDAVGEPMKQGRGGSWYLAKAIAGYGGGLVVQTSSIALPPASLTLVAVLQRVVGGFVGLVSAAILPSLVHRGGAASRKAVVVGHSIGALVGLAAIPTFFIVSTRLGRASGVTAVVGLAWLAVAIYASITQRLAYKLLTPRSSLASIVSSVCVAAAVVTLATVGSLTLKGIVLAMLLVDASPTLFLASAMRQWPVVAAVAGLSAGAICAAVVF